MKIIYSLAQIWHAVAGKWADFWHCQFQTLITDLLLSAVRYFVPKTCQRNEKGT